MLFALFLWRPFRAQWFGACVFGWPLLLLRIERWFPAVGFIKSFSQWLLACIVEIPGFPVGVYVWVMITRNKIPRRLSRC